MTAPTLGETTTRLYTRLPEVYLDADRAQADGDDGFPLARYLSLTVDQAEPPAPVALLLDGAGIVEILAAAVTDAAVARWLPWLAQFVGLDLDTSQSIEDQADEIGPDHLDRWQRGTRAAIAARARTVLTDTQTVEITSHYGDDPWVIGVGTLDDETPTLTTWADLEEAATGPDGVPTWAQLEYAGTWSGLTYLPLLIALRPELPAGCRFVRYSLD